MRNLPRSIRSPAASRRAGSLLPATAVALLAILGGAALVVDRLALDTAKNELRVIAEAAALAAARELANDDRLRPGFDAAALQMKCRFAAARIVAENFIAGEPLLLDSQPNGDVRFGQLVKEDGTGETVFAEVTEEEATSVVVQARRTAATDSSIQLPFRTLYAPSEADVMVTAEATLDFHVIGLRSIGGAPAPTLPLAILSRDLSPSRPSDTAALNVSSGESEDRERRSQTASWHRDVEQRNGTDRFGYDSSTGDVTNQSDGIPEIVLRTAASSSSTNSNAFVLSLAGELSESTLSRHIRDGWLADDFDSIGGEFRFDRGPLTMAGLRGVDCNILAGSLRKVLGQTRVVFLYDRVGGESNASVATLGVSGMVAGRVMSVREVSESECEIVFQPAVLATRAAVTADAVESASPKNKYIANLRLTN